MWQPVRPAGYLVESRNPSATAGHTGAAAATADRAVAKFTTTDATNDAVTTDTAAGPSTTVAHTGAATTTPRRAAAEAATVDTADETATTDTAVVGHTTARATTVDRLNS